MYTPLCVGCITGTKGKPPLVHAVIDLACSLLTVSHIGIPVSRTQVTPDEGKGGIKPAPSPLLLPTSTRALPLLKAQRSSLPECLSAAALAC